MVSTVFFIPALTPKYVLLNIVVCFLSLPPDSHMIHAYSEDPLCVQLSQTLQNLYIIDM